MYITYCAGCGQEITTSTKPTELTFEYCGECPDYGNGELYPGATRTISPDGREVITLDKLPFPHEGSNG